MVFSVWPQKSSGEPYTADMSEFGGKRFYDLTEDEVVALLKRWMARDKDIYK